jgi:cytoskeletal protein CcmA (bactofilin family)
MFKKNKAVDDGVKPFSEPANKTFDKTIIGEQIIIEGDISGNGDLVIDGSVKGRIDVQAHHLTVGPKGSVESEIHAADVTISGKLVGNVNAENKVVITKEADFNGEIKARSISVEDGALLKAVIELTSRDDKKESAFVNSEDKFLPKTDTDNKSSPPDSKVDKRT